jgi:L-aspartate oxidase
MEICDVLIIGSGVAGLSLAIKLSQQFPKLRIFVITKGDELESNTRYAQGGVSVVCDFKSDSFEQHIQDTLAAGAGLCKMEVVESVIRYGQKALVDLMKNGVTLDREINGDYMLGREGGHSQSRIVHYKDMTGFQIAVSLLLKAKTLPGITLLSNYTAIDLITSRQMGNALNQIDECNGVFALNDKAKRIEKFISRMTVIATGGVGQVYATTTNPKIATGDGIGMAIAQELPSVIWSLFNSIPLRFIRRIPEVKNFLYRRRSEVTARFSGILKANDSCSSTTRKVNWRAATLCHVPLSMR